MTYDFDTLLDRRNTQSVKWDTLEDKFGSVDVLPMWVADTDFPILPSVLDAMRDRLTHPAMGYTVVPDSFYESAQQWFSQRHGWQTERAWFQYSPSVLTALSIAINTFTEPGDKVVIQPPVYHPFPRIVQDNERTLIHNPLRVEDGEYFMDLDDLERHIDDGAKMLILCNPHNPVGRVWPKEQLLRLGELCARRGVLVIADEIHADLVFSGHTHVPFASISDELAQISVTCIAPTKTFNFAGLPISMAVIPNPELRQRFLATIQRYALTHPNLLSMVALETAYREGGDWLDQLMVYLEGNRDELVRFFQERVPAIRVRAPEGTYLAWLDCRALGLADEELKRFFDEEAKVGLNQGELFGPGGHGFARLNFACSRTVLRAGLARIEAAVARRPA